MIKSQHQMKEIGKSLPTNREIPTANREIPIFNKKFLFLKYF